MKINSLRIENFRNIENMQLNPCSGVNIIYGDNAQGKTNLIESIWLFTGAKSFRQAKDSELVKFGCEAANLNMKFFAKEREQTARISLAEKKRAFLNDIQLNSVTGLAEEFYAVVFSPVHLSLVKEGPALRRRFLDTAICQLKPKYIKLISDYTRVISQRNSLLKDIYYHAQLIDTLDIWDEHIVSLSASIIKMRKSYIAMLKKYACEAYKGISNSKEMLELEYTCSFKEENEAELKIKIAKELKKSRAEDIKSGVTSLGPHRDDIEIKINGISARQFGSQGQQRSCVLALKLAECEIIHNITGEQPVVLLDDVMSELDSSRRDYLLNNLAERQVFITCCEQAYFANLKDGLSFNINNGRMI
ncbi:MAG TPA: DNA replication/repair protein RecF [Ruminococcaceae bacterium]|nr:DNA replication/repair protein RecF [Oscillospiraceae bacterium]